MLETVFLIVVVLSGYSIFLVTRVSTRLRSIDDRRLIVTEHDVPFRATITFELTTEIAFNSIQMSNRIAVNDSIQITKKCNSNNNNGIS